MTEEKKKILDRVNELISKKKNELLNQLPDVHEIDDGIIIRFFGEWDSCSDSGVKYKKIPNISKPEETVYFFYLPKGTILEMKKREYISCITCLNGSIELEVNGELHFLNAYNKMCLENNEFCGKTLENTYLISTNIK